MFRLTPAPTFRAPVPLSVPGQDAPIEVTFEFRHKTVEALTEWLARAPGRSDVDLLNDVIVSWAGIVDGGEPVPYSPTALATLIASYGPAKEEIFNAYVAELQRGKRKN